MTTKITQSNIVKLIALVITFSIIGYILFEWGLFFRSIEEVNRSEFVGFVSFVGSYCILLSFLVLLGWVIFRFRLYSGKNFPSSSLVLSSVYLSIYLLFFLVLRNVFSDEDQYTPENMLLAGVGLAITIVAERLFSANKQKQLQLTYEKERQKAELALIKAQVNPHFLFNSLNTLYKDALKIEAQEITANLEKLTDILRYQLHYASHPFISLAEEINFIRQFVDFHKHRFDSEESVRINLKIDVSDQEYLIRPMILITFIENAFKHGISLEKPSRIDLMISERNGKLSLEVINTNHPKEGKMSTGVGLLQTRKMLEAYYPKYLLSSDSDENDYRVTLKLELKKIGS